MQRLGQHFLKNKSVLAKIAGALEMGIIIEVGPGHGELTDILLVANDKKKIILIEKDAMLCRALEEKFGGDARVVIHEGDALKVLPMIVNNLIKIGSSYQLVGNIPYYITGKLLRTISELKYKPERTALLLQQEVAERICAIAPHMNRLAASVQFWAETSIIDRVPKGDFSPPPEVDSAIIVLKTKKEGGSTPAEKPSQEPPPGIHAERYYGAVRTIFAQPRKTLLNNLRPAAEKEKIVAVLLGVGIAPEARPQDLSIEQIEAIAALLF